MDGVCGAPRATHGRATRPIGRCDFRRAGWAFLCAERALEGSRLPSGPGGPRIRSCHRT